MSGASVARDTNFLSAIDYILPTSDYLGRKLAARGVLDIRKSEVRRQTTVCLLYEQTHISILFGSD